MQFEEAVSTMSARHICFAEQAHHNGYFYIFKSLTRVTKNHFIVCCVG